MGYAGYMTLEKLYAALGGKAAAAFRKANKGIAELLPAQEKALSAGLLSENLLVCTPTASGKTLIAEIAALDMILNKGKKVLYLVPLKALASEKYKALKGKYEGVRVATSYGDLDEVDPRLGQADLIITTTEKMDSLLRHRIPWVSEIGYVVVDEIHLLNDPSRGPTLEVLIVLLQSIVPDVRLLGLSATIGNPEELAAWLSARLVMDAWRPVRLEKGIYTEKKLVFYEKDEDGA